MGTTPKRPRRGTSPRRTAPKAPVADDWRDETLARLRLLILSADPLIVEEQKWKKPSNPEGVPVWYHDRIVCLGNILKNSVRLTFPYGVDVRDPHKLFNTRLESKTTRGIDFYEDQPLNEAAVVALIKDAVRVNGVIVAERAARQKIRKR